MTVLGIAILTGFEPRLDKRMILGDLLALGSAICFGFYSVAGRAQRDEVPLFTYAATVYGLAAAWLAVPGWMLYTPGTVTWRCGLAVLAAGVFPLATGHTLYNGALRRLHPTIVNIIATQEVTGGVILGVLVLGEMPTTTTLLGAAVAIAGFAWTLRLQALRQPVQPALSPGVHRAIMQMPTQGQARALPLPQSYMGFVYGFRSVGV